MEISEIVIAVGAVLSALLVIAKVIAKLTPSVKDDKIVSLIEGIVGPIVKATDGSDSEKE